MVWWILLMLSRGEAASNYSVLHDRLVGDDREGRYTQVVMAGELPVVAFNDEGNGGAAIRACQDVLCANWTSTVVDPSADSNNARFLAMTLFRGLPVLAYAMDERELRLARCLDQSCARWTVDAVESGHTAYPSLAVRGDELVMAYYYDDDDTTHVAFCGDDCKVERPGVGGKYPALVLAPDPVFAYYSDMALYVAKCDGAYCASATVALVDARDDSGKYCVMTLVHGVSPLIVYLASETGALRAAAADTVDDLVDGANVSFATLDNIGVDAYGVFPELDVTSQSLPLLSYFNSLSNTTGSLNLAACFDPRCLSFQRQTLASGEAGFGRDSSIAFGRQTNLTYVSLLDYQQTGDDKHARLLVLSS